ncbi:MAG: cobalamin B12-binding domain-containing protein [Paracoccaceae bacterium]
MERNDNSQSNRILKDQITRLANEAISAAQSHLGSHTSTRLTAASTWLSTYVLRSDFDKLIALSTLTARGITADNIVDHCIPFVACSLGEDWVSDTLSFSEVTIGSVHLQLLLKHITQSRKSDPRRTDGKCLVIVVLENEQHSLGALVLSDQLRRKGYSLRLMLNTKQADVVTHLKNNSCCALLFSAGSEHTARQSAQCVNKIRQSLNNSPKVLLGGPILTFGIPDEIKSDFNLISNDLDLIIDEIENNVIPVGSHAELGRLNL